MVPTKLIDALTRLYAALMVGRELMRHLDLAVADGQVSEAELGALAVDAVRLYERLTGRRVLAAAPDAGQVQGGGQ